MQDLTQQPSKRRNTTLAAASNRRHLLRIADTLVVVGLIASYATSGRSVEIHAVVGLAFTTVVAWHFWLHRAWFRSVRKRLAKNRSKRSRRSAYITVAVAIDLTLAIGLGSTAWLGTRLLSGPHTFFASVLVVIAVFHVLFNLKQLKALVRRRTIVVNRRFRGTESSAQNGYAAGAAASFAEGTVEVLFEDTVPLGQDLTVEIDPEERIVVLNGPSVVMDVVSNVTVSVEVPFGSDVIDEVFNRRQTESPGGGHRPDCFGCGLDRNDGLGITMAPIGSTGIWGTVWTPEPSLPRTDDFINDEIIWAALDCPGTFAALGTVDDRSLKSPLSPLSSMTVQIKNRIRVGEPLAVLAWSAFTVGSRTTCGVAIVDRGHHIKAYAHLTYDSRRA